jgi:D-galactarolactone isomerase
MTHLNEPPESSASIARVATPPGACDCHMHVFDPRFDAVNSSSPAPPPASVERYRQEVQVPLGLQRVIVVQSNRYGSNNLGMLEAMAHFGAAARGVAVVPPDVTEAELARLTALGVRGVRFHMLPGGALQWPQLDAVVARVKDFGWHVQVQLNGWELPEHLQRLRSLPLPCVVDHIGKYIEPAPPRAGDHAFTALQHLLDSGRAWVKVSAPYESSRSGPPAYADVSALAQALIRSHPQRCVWASNWPHLGRDPAPDNLAMLDLLSSWAGNEATRRRVLVDNPAELYGFEPQGGTPA